MKIEKNEAINNDPIDENPIDKTNVWAEAKLLRLDVEIEEKQEKFKKLEDLYDIYNNLLEKMDNLYAYKSRELNDVLDKLKVYYEELHNVEIHLKLLNRLIEEEESRLQKIKEKKEKALDLPFV